MHTICKRYFGYWDAKNHYGYVLTDKKGKVIEESSSLKQLKKTADSLGVQYTVKWG
jgi:hypothetical protein